MGNEKIYGIYIMRVDDENFISHCYLDKDQRKK